MGHVALALDAVDGFDGRQGKVRHPERMQGIGLGAPAHGHVGIADGLRAATVGARQGPPGRKGAAANRVLAAE